MSALAQKQHMVSKTAARKPGTAITFTLVDPGTHDPTTGNYTSGSTSTVVGVASRIPGDAERYRALELIESESPTLQFTPDTYGETPALNSSCSWSGVTHYVRDIVPWAPDGSTVSCRVVVTRG